MIIERLDLIAFGQFTNAVLDLSAGPNRFHIVYGPNESGKSTSMRAIHSLLFGMPQRSDDNFIHAYPAMRIGGKFRDAETGDVIQCVRRRGKTKTFMTPDESAEVDSARLTAMLRGVDAETFSRQFGLSHHELVSGGRAIIEGGGDLGETLFAAGTGTGTLRTARMQLEKDRRELFIERGSSGTINKLIARFTETEKQLRECRLLPLQYDSKHKELDNAILEAQNLEQQLKTQNQSHRLMKAYHDAQRLLPDRENILAQLRTPIGSTPLLDDNFITSRRQLEAKWQSTAQRLATYRDQIAELLRRHDQLPVDSQWGDVTPKIKSLMNELSEVQAGRKQLDRLHYDLADTDRKIANAIKRLGQTTSDASDIDSNILGATLDPLSISETVRNEIDTMVTRYGGLIESLQLTEDNVTILRQSQEQVAAQLATMPPVRDVTPLVDAMSEVGKPRILLDAVAKSIGDEEKSSRAVIDSLARLRGFSGGVDDVRQLLPPPESKIAELSGAIVHAKSELHQRQISLETAQERLKESQAIFDELSCDSDLPTLQQREDARSDRDATVAKLRSAIGNREPLDPHCVDTLEKRIRFADEITDRLHQAHDQVTRRHRLSIDIVKANQQVDLAMDRSGVAARNLDDVIATWNELWLAHHVIAGSPDEMRQWISDLSKLKETISAWDDSKAAVSAARAAVDRAVEHLMTAMRLVDSDPQTLQSQSDRQDLNEIYSLATLLKDSANRRALTRTECEAELKRADTALKKAHSEQKKYQREWERWQSRWQELIAQIAVASSARPENIHSIIRQIDETQTLCQKRDSIASSLQSTQHNQQEYFNRVHAIARLLQLDFQPDELSDFVVRLSRQSDEYLKRDNERELLAQQIQVINQKIQTASDDEKTLLAQLNGLCAEAGAEDVSQLPAIEQASAKRRELEKDRQTIDQQLRSLAASEPLEVFIEHASQQDPVAFEIELSKSEAEREHLHQRWTTAQQTVGKLRGEVEQMDASDQAAMIQQERQNLLAAMRRQANRYAELTIAEEALKRAIEHYRQNNEVPVLRRASNFFSRLTDGEYQRLQIEFDDKDQPKLVGVRPDAKSTVVANLMSDGTADALYLSLRLASLEVHLDTHHPVPLIVDDCLVQFDDDRASAALKILSEMSARTQVILFTHHQHLLDLARESLPADGFHAHRLDKQFVAQSIGRS